MIVINKPAGLLTMATDREKTKTAYAMLRAYLNNKRRPEKVFIVHRLDREASGLVVFAKSAESKERLQDQFKDHSAGRRYVAVVEGRVKEDAFTVQSYLAENAAYRVYSTHNQRDGKLAVTHIKVLEAECEDIPGGSAARDRTQAPDSRASRRARASDCRRQGVWQRDEFLPAACAPRRATGLQTPGDGQSDVFSVALSAGVGAPVTRECTCCNVIECRSSAGSSGRLDWHMRFQRASCSLCCHPDWSSIRTPTSDSWRLFSSTPASFGRRSCPVVWA